jgi:hypothetical protein
MEPAQDVEQHMASAWRKLNIAQLSISIDIDIDIHDLL